MLLVVLQLREGTAAELYGKLPDDLKSIIMQYGELLKNEGIIPLLESSQADFKVRFEEAAKHLLEYMFQLESLIVSKYGNDKSVLDSLIEFNSSGLDAIEKEFTKPSHDEISTSITNALEIIRNYRELAVDERMQVELVKPEYSPAFGAFGTVLLTIYALTVIITSDNQGYSQKTNFFIQILDHFAHELEDYVETIEIETDPEQGARLERIKTS